MFFPEIGYDRVVHGILAPLEKRDNGRPFQGLSMNPDTQRRWAPVAVQELDLSGEPKSVSVPDDIGGRGINAPGPNVMGATLGKPV